MKIANPFERFGITQADYDGNENYGRFVIEPLERGFGLTLLYLRRQPQKRRRLLHYRRLYRLRQLRSGMSAAVYRYQ